MSRLVVPIAHRILWRTGDLLLWVALDLHLKDHASAWHRETFRVDTGTQVTTMSAYEAKSLGLPLPAHAARGVVHQQTGLEFRSGYLRFQIVGMDPAEYVIPCLFLGDPDTPAVRTQHAALPRNLLQPFHLLDRLRFTFDRDPSPAAPYGTLTVERKTP